MLKTKSFYKNSTIFLLLGLFTLFSEVVPKVYANLVLDPATEKALGIFSILSLMSILFLVPFYNTVIEYLVGKKYLKKKISKRQLFRIFLRTNYISYYPAFIILLFVNFLSESLANLLVPNNSVISVVIAILIVEILVIFFEKHLLTKRFSKLYDIGRISEKVSATTITRIALVANATSALLGYTLVFLIGKYGVPLVSIFL